MLDYLCDTSRDDYFLISEQYKKNYGEEIGIYALLAYQGLDTIFRFVQEQKITNFQSIPEQIDGYEIDSFLGHIKIQQQEFVFPLKLKPVISPE